MNTRTKISVILALLMAVAAALALLCTQVGAHKAYADETDVLPSDGYIVSDDTEKVAAVYEFTALNETDCSVRIVNKAAATKAVIPPYAEIDGKRYKVTEIVNSGSIY